VGMPMPTRLPICWSFPEDKDVPDDGAGEARCDDNDLRWCLLPELRREGRAPDLASPFSFGAAASLARAMRAFASTTRGGLGTRTPFTCSKQASQTRSDVTGDCSEWKDSTGTFLGG
jgi:hypothetical protein